MRSDKDNSCERLNRNCWKSSDRDSFKSYSDDEFFEDNLRHRILSLQTNLYAEYCSELPNSRVEQLCRRR